MKNSTEEQHIQILSKGNQKAYELLFLHYYPKLVHFIAGFIKENEMARDMAQDVFLTIWNDREKLSAVKSFQAYLFKIAKNNICNYFDRLIVKEKYITEQLFQNTHSDETEELIFARQLQEMINIAVSEMPSQRKTIYTMSRVEGLTNDEIAEKLNISKRTVENHLTAALADIKKVIITCLFIYVNFTALACV